MSGIPDLPVPAAVPATAFLAALVDSAPVAIIVADSRGRLRLVNRAAEELFGYPRAELVGRLVEMLVPAASRAAHAGLRDRFLAHPVAGRMGQGREVFGERRDGSRVPLEVALTPLDTDEGRFIALVAVDVGVRRALETEVRHANETLEARVRERTQQLERAAHEREMLLAELRAQRAALERLSREDPLTGLANRRDFDQRLGVEIHRAERGRSPLSVAMLDLDRFKAVNDRYGHALGDTVLRETGALVADLCRATDVVARYGGEEFALALPDTTLDAAAGLCERIRVAFERHDWQRLAPGLAVRVSAGVAAWRPGAGADALLAEADANLYRAKEGGRNRVVPPP